MIVVAGIGLPLVFIYTFFIYKIFVFKKATEISGY